MSNDKRLRQISSNMAEEDRRKMLSQAADKRRDIEETLGTDVINHEALVKMAYAIWMNVPASMRKNYSAEDWRRDITAKLSRAIEAAEDQIQRNNTDERMLQAKLTILRQTFAKQVHRAMNDVAKMLNGGQ